MRLADRMTRLGTETAFEVLARARALEAEGKHIVHLEIGEPDFDTPLNVIDAACDALRHSQTHYTPSAGIPDLRAAIAADATTRKGVAFTPAEVVVTPGAKPIIFFIALALINEGDEVIYPNPGFPIYESMINFVGGKAVPVGFIEEQDFALDVDQLCARINEHTRLVVLNTPHNPTGGCLSRAELQAIADAVQHYPECMVLADEIYSRMVYDGEFVSIASLPGMQERTIVLDGFSKIYAMTGWRLGYGIMPEALAQQVARLMTNSNSCTATFTQVAGVAALTGPQADAEAMVAEFKQRRDLIVNGLNQIPGITCRMPRGAFYAFPNITQTGMSSRQMADLLLYEGGVASLAGTAFGANGEGYLRFSYANSMDQLQLALDRIRATVGQAIAAH